MAVKTWPNGLPGNDGKILKNGFQDLPADNLNSSPMEDGSKTRRKFTRGVSKLTGTWRFTLSQYEVFRVFVRDDLKDGVLQFRFNHPLRDYDVAAGFVPQDNGRPFVAAPAPSSPAMLVNFELEYLDRAVA